MITGRQEDVPTLLSGVPPEARIEQSDSQRSVCCFSNALDVAL